MNRNLSKFHTFRAARLVPLGLAVLLLAHAPTLAATVVRVGLHDAAPLAYRDAAGVVRGFSIEVLEHIAESEDWRIEYRYGTWNECIDKLRRGEIDLLFPTLSTDARLADFAFSHETLISTWGQVFARPQSSIESILDLDGKTVAVIAGDRLNEELRLLVDRFGLRCTFLELPGLVDTLEALSAERADAAALESKSAQWHATRYDLRATPVVFGPTASHFAAQANGDGSLIEALDRHLARLKSDRTSVYHRAYDEWFGDAQRRTWPGWLVPLMAGAAVLLVLFGGFSLTLRRQVTVKTRELSARNRQLEREVAERRRSEQDRRDLEERLRQSQKMEAMGTLAAGVAHEFNNLLMVISGHAALVKERISEDSDLRESLQVMDSAVEQATGFTRSLLSFSRSVPGYRSPIDVCAAVRSAAEMLRRTLPASIELLVEADADPAPWVKADENQLRQLLLNLAVNSRDAMPDGGILRIAVSVDDGEDDDPQEGGRALLTVSDTGKGMPGHIRARIFEPFFSTKSKTEGTGLGLAFVDAVVTESGGQIDVQSAEGAGTTFVIALPRVVPAERSAIADSETRAAAGRGQRVLLAEDQQQVREVLASFLTSLGYAVEQAGDGQLLRTLYERHSDDLRLMIIDVDLPKRNGLDVLDELRGNGSRIPAIVITGGIDVEIAADDSHSVLLNKPFRLTDLGSLVFDMIEERWSERSTA